MAKQIKVTRREALSAFAGTIGVSMLPSNSLFSTARSFRAEEPAVLAPATSLLKKRFKTRTINVHAHVLGAAKSIVGQRGGLLRRAAGDPDRPITDMERQQALTYFNRFVHGRMKFDSKEQEDKYVKKYAMSRRTPLRGIPFEDNAVRFLKEMDDAGIDTSVIHLLEFARASQFGETTLPPTGRYTEPTLAACHEFCKQHPGRFIPFAGIDVRRGKEGTKLLEKAVKEYGFKGCGEIVTTLWQTPPNDKEKCYPYYEKCLELGIPVMIDATMDHGFTQPHMYEEVARQFPKLKICLGGAGIRVAPVERDGKKVIAYDRMLQLAEYYENIWLDLDDWQAVGKEDVHRFLDFLRRALNGPAKHKVMYGSDYPIFAWMYTEAEWIEVILKNADSGEIKFTEKELAMFFSTNAMSYLGLS